MVGSPLLQDAVDADRLIELPVVEIGRGQAVDRVDAVIGALVRQVSHRSVDGVDARVSEDDVPERLLAQLHAIGAHLALGVRDHLLEFGDRRLVGAGVVVAPSELVERKRVDLREPERGRFRERLARAPQVVAREEVLTDLHVRVWDESALGILPDERAVIGDALLLVPALVQVVPGDEEDLVAPPVRRISLEDLPVEPDRLLAVLLAAPRVEPGLLALGLLQPLRGGVVVLPDLLGSSVARLLPPQLRELEVDVGAALALRRPRDDGAQVLDHLVALAIRRGVALAVAGGGLSGRRPAGRREDEEQRYHRARHSPLLPAHASLTV